MEPLPPPPAPLAVVMMGVAGSGKTTVGRALAEALGWPFCEGDELHPASNLAKMGAGIPLDDADRAPWLEAIRERIAAHLGRGESVVVACSALKEDYRRRFAAVPGRVEFVFLNGDPALLRRRLAERQGHYMKAGMLDSQFAALQPPSGAIEADAAASPSQIVAQVRRALGR